MYVDGVGLKKRREGDARVNEDEKTTMIFKKGNNNNRQMETFRTAHMILANLDFY